MSVSLQAVEMILPEKWMLCGDVKKQTGIQVNMCPCSPAYLSMYLLFYLSIDLSVPLGTDLYRTP